MNFSRWTRRNESERGASLVEYSLLIALISVVSIGAVTALGDASSDSFEGADSGLRSGGAALSADSAYPGCPVEDDYVTDYAGDEEQGKCAWRKPSCSGANYWGYKEAESYNFSDCKDDVVKEYAGCPADDKYVTDYGGNAENGKCAWSDGSCGGEYYWERGSKPESRMWCR